MSDLYIDGMCDNVKIKKKNNPENLQITFDILENCKKKKELNMIRILYCL